MILTAATTTTAALGVSAYDHFTLMSTDLLLDLAFYEDLFGARVLPRTVGRYRQVGERPAYVNFSVSALKKNLPPIIFVAVSGSVWGLFLQPDYPPEPDRMLQGARHGLSVPGAQFEAVLKTLSEREIKFEGPFEHEAESRIARSVYFKDPSGNSLELCVERSPGPTPMSGLKGQIPVSRLLHLSLDETDLDRAEGLYGQGLGIEVAYRGTTMDGGKKSVLHLKNGQIVTLQLVDKVPSRLAWKTRGHIDSAFVVEDGAWAATESGLVSRGIKLLPDPVRKDNFRLDDQESVYFSDQDNNVIQLFTPKMFGA
jgi:catechol 2,3-dioxygenase-like lactoylglutathione lyase family enzyme